MAALSKQLIDVHRALRERLTSLRQEAAGGAGLRAADTAAGEDLLSHCLSFCSAIHTHHTGEDSQLLPALRAAVPDLAPVIDNLLEDHALVAGILRQVHELLTPGRASSGPGAVVRELDGLSAILESHFGYEERRIAKALDTLGPGAWTAEVFVPGLARPGTYGLTDLVGKIKKSIRIC